MTAREFETLGEAAAAELVCSRFRSLVEAGCDSRHAAVLAVHPQFAVDEAVELLSSSKIAELAVGLLGRRPA